MAEEHRAAGGAPGSPGEDPTLRSEAEILAAVDRAVAGARDLRRWWRKIDAEAYRERFELSTPRGGPEAGYGFFDQAEIEGSELAVMGHVLAQVYDRPKTMSSPADPSAGRQAAWTRAQVREFVLRYFLRVSDFSAPQAFAGTNGHSPPPYLQPFSWYPDDSGGRGFGFEQLYCRRKGSDLPERFAPEDRHAVVDLREIGTTYEWVVLKAEVFDFQLVLAPFGQSYPHGTLPATEASLLVLHEAFIEDEQEPEAGGLGRYGLGFAFLPAAEESFLAHGLGRFDAAFQLIRFDVEETGVVTSRAAFVASRPKAAVRVDPVDWGLRMADRFSFGAASTVLEPMQRAWSQMPGAGGVDLVQAFITTANMVTSGAAERSLGLSKKQLHKNLLVTHLARVHHLLASSLVAWRRIPDWLDRDALPAWAISGRGE